MDSHSLRAVLVRIQDLLSDDDRENLHFYLGNDVPRRIRDDASLRGTLKLMQSLFDQDKINDQDFNFLIDAFDEIKCTDAVQILREHRRKMQGSGQDQSVQNLTSILLQDHEDQEDKYVPRHNSIAFKKLINHENLTTNVNNNHTNLNLSTVIVDKHPSVSNQQRLPQISPMTTRLLLLIALIVIIISIGVIGVCIVKIKELSKALEMKNAGNYNQRRDNDTSNSESQKLTNKMDCSKQMYGSLNKMCDRIWMDARDGEIPAYAVAGGRENDRLTYVVRIEMAEGAIIPGKLVEGGKVAYAEYHGVRNSSTYQVLINPESKWNFSWITPDSSGVPECALPAGKESYLTLYVGRTLYSSNLMVVGKYNGPHGPLYVVHRGQRVETNKNVEVLCIS